MIKRRAEPDGRELVLKNECSLFSLTHSLTHQQQQTPMVSLKPFTAKLEHITTLLLDNQHYVLFIVHTYTIQSNVFSSQMQVSNNSLWPLCNYLTDAAQPFALTTNFDAV